ncbi:MAG: hypothetical protein DRG78_09330 [Epsilonproteobacteria bacterium]|nr:MAG: hypothetical protein DRG78_09330 [Campylobacterota bacterium]
MVKNKIIDLRLYLCYIKQYIHQIFYVSAVQAKVFSIVKQLNGSMNGYRRYSLKGITNNIMKLQELMLSKEGNSFCFYKLYEARVMYQYILIHNNSCNECFEMSHININQIDLIFKEILNSIEIDNYLNEKEILDIIEKHKIKRKYNGK